MDSDRFDVLTRSLSAGMTRRGLTRLLGGLILSLLGPIALEAKKRDHRKHGGKGKGPGKTGKHGHKKGQTGSGKTNLQDTAEHKADSSRDTTKDAPESARTVTASATSVECSPSGTSCTRDRQCCSRKCSGQGLCRCNEANPCPGSKTCQNGQCVCPVGTKSCNDACIVSSDCCGNADCPSGQDCQSGQCGCPDGKKACDGGCVNTQIDPEHCGACGVACDGGTGTCKNGACATPEVCDGVDNDFDGEIDEDTRCPGTKVCEGGKCVCSAGTQDCNGDGNCESLDTDQYCGGCNTACTGGQVCQSGQCVTPPASCNEADCTGDEICDPLVGCVCPKGTKKCGDRCVDTQTDPNHCGGCDPHCAGGQVCQGGECVYSSCVTDAECLSDQVCSSGKCGPSCGDGVCSGSDTCRNCPGECGPCTGTECTTDADCYSGLICQDGQCHGTECTMDADCVPATCCHPGGCVPVAQAPVCDGIACDAGCQEWTLDCGQAYCTCRDGECVAVQTEICGDGWCSGSETCSSCPEDCCPT